MIFIHILQKKKKIKLLFRSSSICKILSAK